MSELGGLATDLTRFLDDSALTELKHAAGGEGKDSAHWAAERDLGADRRFSGFRRRNARLSAGYDIESGTRLTLNLRPKGLWYLANDGRRRVKPKVVPRQRGGSAALNTPWGPRASVRGSKSRGLGTLADAENRIVKRVPQAVEKALAERIREVF